ncbi:hypothetical protein MBLNU457_3696t1 [Dothideomycetes sp. NU457]
MFSRSSIRVAGLRPVQKRAFSQAFFRRQQQQPSYEPPTQPPPAPNHREFYKTFGRPMAKVFLGAMFTYQVLWICWTKLENVDIEHTKGS